MTNKEKAIWFGRYPNAKVWYKPTKSICSIVSIMSDGYCTLGVFGEKDIIHAHIKDCQLILKPLEDISEEEYYKLWTYMNQVRYLKDMKYPVAKQRFVEIKYDGFKLSNFHPLEVFWLMEHNYAIGIPDELWIDEKEVGND